MYDLPLAGSSAHAMHSGLSGLTLWHSRWGRHSLKKKEEERERPDYVMRTGGKEGETAMGGGCTNHQRIAKFNTLTKHTKTHTESLQPHLWKPVHMAALGIHSCLCWCLCVFVHNELHFNDWTNRIFLCIQMQKRNKRDRILRGGVTIGASCCTRATVATSTHQIWLSFRPGSLK